MRGIGFYSWSCALIVVFLVGATSGGNLDSKVVRFGFCKKPKTERNFDAAKVTFEF